MIVYACKYFPDQPWVQAAVQSARSWMPEEPVLVVDSDSADTSYFAEVQAMGAEVLDSHNTHYETGAWWAAYHHSDATYFFFLHDSTRLQASLATWKAQPVTVFGYLTNFDGCDTNHTSRIQGVAAKAGFEIPDPFYGVFGSMFGCQRNAMDNLAAACPEPWLPDDKQGSECAERVWGLALADIGIDAQAVAWGPGENLCRMESPLFKFLSRRT